MDFLIDDNYRITVYQRKTGSLRQFAVVKYQDEVRYYRIDRSDYSDAVALVHTPGAVSDVFQAKILEIRDGYFLVEPVEGSLELNSADQIEIPMQNMDPALEPQVGDMIEISYSGEILETYPAKLSDVYRIRVVREAEDMPDWGITLEAKNATPEGATIICTQDGGYLPNRLFYGSDYNLQKYENNQWVDVAPVTELYWKMAAYSIPFDDSISWNINWTNTFGILESGVYRFCKGISDHRASGDNDYAVFYAVFEIP